MIEIIFSVLIMLFTAIAGVNFFYQYCKLRNLLKQHNRPLPNIFYYFGILIVIKNAKSLIEDLGPSEEGLRVKNALRITDLSFMLVFVVFFGFGAIFLIMIK